MSEVFLACAEANVALASLRPGSIHLVNTSPRYLDLIDYHAAAEGRDAWRPTAREALEDYFVEHLDTCRWLAEVTAADSVVAVEVDNYRDIAGRCLVPLPDYWRAMLQAAGFRIAECITLVRRLAIGRRSGHFKRHGGRPGYAYLDNVTSSLIVAFKGDPMARLRRDARPGDTLDVAWAERFLRNAWVLRPPRRRAGGHPVPQDPEVVRAILSFYSLPGDHVLDPFAGSGTTGRIALALGRRPLLIEREAPYVDAMRAEFGTCVRPLAAASPRVHVSGAQFHLPFDATVQVAARNAFLQNAVHDVTTRYREIARVASEMSGLQWTPEMVGILMTAERRHYARRRSAA